jgi:hypothetical protein
VIAAPGMPNNASSAGRRGVVRPLRVCQMPTVSDRSR